MSLTKKVFLLGGHDLEMLTIGQMLEGRDDCVVLDKGLCWSNARLSAYEEELQDLTNGEIYGVELQEDTPLPHNYHRIDHHNDWNEKPSALEQVAEVIGVTLNRHQQLVAANDKGYIPAMHALNATDEEIAEIRRKDRKAQGVTEADERLAEQSIANGLLRCGNLLVVKSQTSRFSAISDRLFPYHRLLIYTDEEWMYYGEGKAELAERYAEDLRQKRMFHGGGDQGYVGTVRQAYSQKEIEQSVEQIKQEYGNL